jgi:arabinofuranosyltransferase
MKVEILGRKLEKTIITVISIGFLIWSGVFIYNSSFIAVDGKRYFCLFDDAMISMRYAWNFSHGLGLVWNPGEYIQGYTNLLMTLLMSLSTLIFDKSTAVLFIQISGAGIMLAIAFVTMKISDHIFQNEDSQRQSFFRVLSFFCALSYYPLAYWSLMGMETGLLTLLLLLGILSAFNYTKSKNISYLFLVSGFFGLAFLTRNESIIFTILIWAYITWITFTTTPKAKLKDFRQLFLTIILYLMFVFGQLAFQYLYYGEILPNTYTLKLTGMPLSERITNGVGFVRLFLIEIFFILFFSSMEVVFAFQMRKLLLISIVFSAIGYQVYVGGDPWNYWRMMSPSMPLLTILFISATNAIVLAISSTKAFKVYFLRNPIFPEKYIPQVLVVLLILIGSMSANVRFLPEILFLRKPYQVEANQGNVNTAIVLNQLTTSDATVGVYWAGSIPYFTDRKAIDFLGKSDRYIAQLPPDVSGSVAWYGMKSVPGHNKYDLNYSIKTLEPTYVQGFKWGAQDLSQWAETKYINVKYNGVDLFLLKDSPAVLWNKINVP